MFRYLPVLPVVFILTNAFHVGVTYTGNGNAAGSGHWETLPSPQPLPPLLTLIPNLIGNYPFAVCVVGVLLYSFNVFEKCKSFWILKNAPKFRDFFTHRTNVHFLYEQFGFSFMGFLGTLPTLYENYIVFTFDR